MTLRNRKVTLGSLAVLLLILCYGCDSLESDNLPDDKIRIEGSKLYTLTNTSAYIDLRALVKTSETIQFKVVSPPRNGRLSEMDKGILQYSPYASFKKGKDYFLFSVLSRDNKVLHQDSVIIIVSSDTTSLPCGLYAVTDSINTSSNAGIIIDVLKNDFLCDSVHTQLQVYKPAANAVPLYGSAVVVNGNKIKYTPNGAPSGPDYIFYKLSSTLDSGRYTFGKVVINYQPVVNVSFALNNDTYTFGKDSLAVSDTLRLAVFDNDYLPGAGYLASIVSPPGKGTATVYPSNATGSIRYVITSALSVRTDSLTYQVCKGIQCKTARAYIKLK